jgi:hypothetical protein
MVAGKKRFKKIGNEAPEKKAEISGFPLRRASRFRKMVIIKSWRNSSIEVDPIMKRLLFLAAFFFVGTGTASADYVLLKINLNQLNFLPSGAMPAEGMKGAAGPGNPGGFAGGKGVGGGMAAGGGFGGMPPGGGMPAGGGFGGMPAGGGFGGMPPGGGFGGMPPGGGFGGMPPGGVPDPKASPGAPPSLYPDDPKARWISALVEINNVSKMPAMTSFGMLFTCETRWSPGKYVWLPVSTMFPMVGAPRIPAESFTTEFTAKFAKEKKDKNIETMLHLARWTLSRGQVKKFHEVMDEAVKIDEKRVNVNVKHYLRVKKGLEAPLKNQDPAQRDLIDNLIRTGYKENPSKQGHYGIYAPNLDDPATAAAVKRRLHLLEETLETFYFWFAMQKDLSAQPALPKYRLLAIVTGSKDDFVSRHADWGSMPRVADGFTPQRDNVIVMSGKPRIDDPNYAELVSLINSKLADANTKLQQQGFKVPLTPESLLSGEVNTYKESGRAAMFIGAAQTAVLLAKAIEDQAERHTATNEGVRQLLVASGMFPRSVQVPDWIVEGLAAFFETPAGTAYPTVGDRSCIHLISFKHHRANNEAFKNPADVLQSVISDSYFQKARQLTKDVQDRRDEKERMRLKESWEVARCSSWAFIYYLSQTRKLDYVFNYGKELDRLPRDMDLSSGVMQGSFAKAFDMAVPGNALVIEDTKMKNMAQNWFDMMQGANLDNGNLQAFLEKERAKQNPTTAPVVVASNPNPGVNTPPNTDPMPPNPNAAKTDLTGTTWGGKETRPGFGPLSFQFAANGQVTMTANGTTVQGKYERQDTAIALSFDGGIIYNGSISNNTMQGNARSGMTQWTWNLTSGAQAIQGVNPNQPGPMPPPKGPKGKGPKG